MAEVEGLIVDVNGQIVEYEEDIEESKAMMASIEAEAEARRQKAIEAARSSQESSDSGSSYTPIISGNGIIGVWPSVDTEISSYYGSRNTGIPGASTDHKGIDIAAYYGTNVFASGDGYVARIDSSYYRGLFIVISHGDGICTLYQHMSGVAVSEGDNVAAGQVIGYIGDSGNCYGAHLHFEVWVNEDPVDPLGYVSY